MMPKRIVIEARREIDAMVDLYPKLVTTLLRGDPASMRLASFLGFSADGCEQRPEELGGAKIIDVSLREFA